MPLFHYENFGADLQSNGVFLVDKISISNHNQAKRNTLKFSVAVRRNSAKISWKNYDFDFQKRPDKNLMLENESKKISFAEFTFNTEGNLLFSREKVVPLEPVAARVLRYFLENGDRIISKDELLDAVWKEVFTTEDVLKRAVSQIRRALGDDAQNPRFLETFHRRGYRFVFPKNGDRTNENFAEINSSEKKSEQVLIENKTIETDDPNFDCFIGRAAEMNFLQTEFRRVLQGAGQPVLIVGEPGIGKTQTAAHFARWTKTVSGNGNSPVSVRVRFFDYEASFRPPYNIFLDLLNEACAAIFGLDEAGENDLRKTVETKLKIVLPDELFSNQPDAPYVFADASRAIVPLAESFVRLSRIRPLVLIFDDVQWADETSRKIIGYLMRIAADAPLMFVGLTRRNDAENAKSAIAEWMRNQAVYRSFTTLDLFPLSTENCAEIIREIFHGRLDTGEIPKNDLLKIHTATGGNPYFLIETLRLLLNENVIEKKVSENDSRWHWRGLKDVPLPETIRMAARAKLSNLPDETRDLVECAAVLGDAFQIETLGLMISSDIKISFQQIEKYLDEAIEAQVLTEQNVSGTDDCQFYHTTLRRAVYMDLSPRRRKRLHFRAMRAIENAHPNERERFAASLAAHAENADEFHTSLKLNLQACRAAVARFDWLEASEILSRAERVAGKFAAANLSETENLEFLALRGEIYMSVGRRAEAENILQKAVALGEKTSDKTDSASILLNLGRTRILLGKYHDAIPVLKRALFEAQRSKNNFNVSAALTQIASAKYALCEYEESSAILQNIILDKKTDDYNRAVALGKLGWTRALQTRYEEGKKLLAEALEFHKTAGDLRERAVLAMCLNWCEYGLGEYEAAIESAKLARSEAQIVGEPYNESVAMMRVAKSRIAQGSFVEAENLLNEVWEKQKDLNAPHAQAETIWMRGRALLALGKISEAEADFEKSLGMIRAVGDRDDEFRILIDQARLQSKLENFSAALNLSEQSSIIAGEIGISEGVAESLIEKSNALILLKDFSAAKTSAEEAVRILEPIGAGELWRALYVLAVAEKESSDIFSSERIEKNLSRSVELLEKIREQFSVEDETRRKLFIESHSLPAKDLHGLFLSQNRVVEAEKIKKDWLFD